METISYRYHSGLIFGMEKLTVHMVWSVFVPVLCPVHMGTQFKQQKNGYVYKCHGWNVQFKYNGKLKVLRIDSAQKINKIPIHEIDQAPTEFF